MGIWREIDSHRVQVLADGGVLWEHDTAPGYTVARHMVGPKHGAVWSVIATDPLSLSPSLHCDPTLGGCGLHGHVSAGHWV